MIGPAARVASWAIVIALAAVGGYLALFYAPEGAVEEPGGKALVRAPRDQVAATAIPRDPAQAEPRMGRSARRLRLWSASRAESGPKAADLRRLDRLRARAEDVARRFFSAFVCYELGELGGRIEARLRSAATTHLAGELLGSPPRVRAPSPAPAALGRLVFVTGEVGPSGELRSAELVGSVARGGRTSPIAIELVHRSGAWLVSGIGR